MARVQPGPKEAHLVSPCAHIGNCSVATDVCRACLPCRQDILASEAETPSFHSTLQSFALLTVSQEPATIHSFKQEQGLLQRMFNIKRACLPTGTGYNLANTSPLVRRRLRDCHTTSQTLNTSTVAVDRAMLAACRRHTCPSQPPDALGMPSTSRQRWVRPPPTNAHVELLATVGDATLVAKQV